MTAPGRSLALAAALGAVLFAAVAWAADEPTSDVPAGSEAWPSPDDSYACKPVGHAAGAFLSEISKNIKSKRAELDRIEAAKQDLTRLKQELVEESHKLQARIDEWDKRMADTKRKEDEAEQKRQAEAKEEGQAKLAKAISKMPPPSAATVLTGLDPALAANLLRRMPPQQAGATLAAMNPQQAARLTTTAIEGPQP